MLTFQHVEDYIEILAGYEPGASVIFNSSKYQFSLARYDVQIVESMGNASVWGNQAYTDKQGELAIKLVLKYRKQFAKYNIDVTPVETSPTWRKPLRTVDRTQRIWIEEGYLKARFPYNQNWIDDFRKFKEFSQGSAQFDYDAKSWCLALTEYNVNWIVAWAEAYKFDIDHEVKELYNKILDSEAHTYAIMLTEVDGKYTITNAAESLINYINEHLGGFGRDNIIKLVDSAGVLGYTIDPSINYPELLDLFGPERVVHVPSTEPGSLDLVFDYAELTGRWPVCIYNPGTTQAIDLSRFDDSEIVRFDPSGRTKTPDYNYHALKVVYANRIPQHWDYPIPLLVSTVEMMHGGRRMEWVNSAEKIVHYSYIKLRDNK